MPTVDEAMYMDIANAMKTVLLYLLNGKLWYLDVAVGFMAVMLYVTGKIDKMVYTTSDEAKTQLVDLVTRLDVCALTIMVCSIQKALDVPSYWIIITGIIGCINIRFPWLTGIVEYAVDIKVYPESEENGEGDDN